MLYYVRVKIEISKPVLEKKEESGPYKKNVLREMNARMQTSPISISKDDVIYNNNNDNYIGEYELDEVYLREESISPLEDMEDNYEVNDSMKFASEIVDDELIKVKDKIYNLTEDEETDEFIDQLKSFRLDL